MLVRVSVLAAPERSFVMEPMSEPVLDAESVVAAEELLSDGDAASAALELVPGTVELLSELGEAVELLLGADDDEDGAVPSAVRHCELLRVSVELEDELEGVVATSLDAVLSVEVLGVLAALGVFAVEEGVEVDCVVVDSATRVCS